MSINRDISETISSLRSQQTITLTLLILIAFTLITCLWIAYNKFLALVENFEKNIEQLNLENGKLKDESKKLWEQICQFQQSYDNIENEQKTIQRKITDSLIIPHFKQVEKFGNNFHAVSQCH